MRAEWDEDMGFDIGWRKASQFGNIAATRDRKSIMAAVPPATVALFPMRAGPSFRRRPAGERHKGTTRMRSSRLGLGLAVAAGCAVSADGFGMFSKSSVLPLGAIGGESPRK